MTESKRMSKERLAELDKEEWWSHDTYIELRDALKAEMERVEELEQEAQDGFDQLAVSEREYTELQRKHTALVEGLQKVNTLLKNSPELNMSNYTEDEAAALNDAVIDAYLITSDLMEQEARDAK